jgi:hypothetical protein
METKYNVPDQLETSRTETAELESYALAHSESSEYVSDQGKDTKFVTTPTSKKQQPEWISAEISFGHDQDLPPPA